MPEPFLDRHRLVPHPVEEPFVRDVTVRLVPPVAARLILPGITPFVLVVGIGSRSKADIDNLPVE